MLAGHEPYPALAIDRHWNLVTANRAVGLFLPGIAPELLEPPVNVLRLSLHPDGLAPRIANLGQWREHCWRGCSGRSTLTADPALGALLENCATIRARATGRRRSMPTRPKSPCRCGCATGGVLAFLSTTTSSAPPSTSRWPSWRSSRSSPPTRPTAPALRAAG